MEVVVTTGAIRDARSSQIVTTNKPTPGFYRPDALPVAQPTVSKYWKETIPICLYDCCDVCSELAIYLFIYLICQMAANSKVWSVKTKLKLARDKPWSECLAQEPACTFIHTAQCTRNPSYSLILSILTVIFQMDPGLAVLILDSTRAEDDGGGDDNRSYKMCKAPNRHRRQTNAKTNWCNCA